MTRIVATADFHGTLPDIPECDLLLIAGDVCPVWDHDRHFQAHWLRTTFNDWLKAQPAQAIVGIGGNHDFVFQDSRIGYDLAWSYLNNEVITVALEGHESFKVYGSPYSNKFGNWAFMTHDPGLGVMYDRIPRDVDIIMTHGPPWGFGDKVLGFSATKRGMVEPEHVGSSSLANQLYYDVWENLKLVVSGHIHEGYGVGEMKNWKIANVSQMDDLYKPVNPPMVFDL